MQKDIHPDYHTVKVILTDGSSFETGSTYKGDKITLDIDPLTHPAWTGGTNFLNENVNKVAKFKERFGNFGFKANQKAAPEAPAAAVEPAKVEAATTDTPSDKAAE
jgi:large subunit ribosomal protein L31